MNIASSQLPFTILVGVLATYTFALWRYLKGEGVGWCLGLIAAVSVLLRLYAADSHPPGLDIDEIKNLGTSAFDYSSGILFGETCTGIPKLIPVVFHVPLEPYVGARWAIRLYSFVGMSLSVPMMFALARALKLGKTASLGGAALIAVLPWSLFYGSVWQGGELVLNQLLLLTALARILSGESRWSDVWVGGVALCLAFYTYFSSRSMLLMPLVVLALRPSRQSAGKCLSILVLAFLGWLPFLLNPANTWTFVGLGPLQVSPQVAADHTQLFERLEWTFRAFYEPVASPANLNLLSAPHAARHPLFMLPLAAVGVVAFGGRRGLFVLAAFVCGLGPAVFSTGPITPSSHRLIQSYPLISLGAAAALNALSISELVTAGVVASVLAASLFGIKLYFSDGFWRDATISFLKENSWLAERLPRSNKPVVAHEVAYLDMYGSVRQRLLPFTQASWFPDKPSIYAFGPRALPLRAFYEDLLGPSRVSTVGKAFWMDFDAPVPRPENLGWRFRLECGGESSPSVVPVVYELPWVRLPQLFCPGKRVTITYEGRWIGPPTSLRLFTSDTATIEAGGATYSAQGSEKHTVFVVQPNTSVRIRVAGPAPSAVLYRNDDTNQLPYWRWVIPANDSDPGPMPP